MQTPTILRQRETTSARLPASTGFLEVTTALFKAKVTWPARPLPTYKLQLLQLKASMEFLVKLLSPVLSQLLNTVFLLGLSVGWRLRGVSEAKVSWASGNASSECVSS